MGRLSIFVLETETIEMIRHLASRRNLGAFTMGAQFYTPFDPVKHAESILENGDRNLMLVPDADKCIEPIRPNDVEPRYQGWIQIRVGRRMTVGSTEIVEMTSFDAEYHKDLPYKSSYWLASYKNELRKSGFLRFGVTMSRIDGIRSERIHNDIGYSKAAFGLYLSGVRWMQYKTNRSYFEPVQREWDDENE